MQFLWRMTFQILAYALLTHVLHNLLGCVECAFVLVVFQQVLEDMAKHFRVDANFRILRVVLVNGEVIHGEEIHEFLEIVVGEVNIFLV